jgi:hypothetical protein
MKASALMHPCADLSYKTTLQTLALLPRKIVSNCIHCCKIVGNSIVCSSRYVMRLKPISRPEVRKYVCLYPRRVISLAVNNVSRFYGFLFVNIVRISL